MKSDDQRQERQSQIFAFSVGMLGLSVACRAGLPKARKEFLKQNVLCADCALTQLFSRGFSESGTVATVGLLIHGRL